MSFNNDPDARWRDPRQYGPSPEALFRRRHTLPLVVRHVDALRKNAEHHGRLVCDAARARHLYEAWIGPSPANPEDLADECHAGFLSALLSHIEWAVGKNYDTRGEKFAIGRDALLALLREFAALEERPLGKSPDFTRHITAALEEWPLEESSDFARHLTAEQLASERSSATHLAAAIMFKASYIPIVGPIFDEDPIFEKINKYSPENVAIDWKTEKARRLFQSASHYLMHGGPDCEQQILVRMSGEGHGEAADAHKDRLRKALEKYIWDENHTRFMDNKRDWTLLNLVYVAGKRMRR